MTSADNEHPAMGRGRDRLEGKVAIVTGANSGIGRATARLFAREGASVVCCDIQEQLSPRIDQLIAQDGGTGLFLRSDATSETDWSGVVDTALERFGALDILYNNAGGGVRGKIGEIKNEEWHFIMNLNLNSIYYGVRAVLPHFLARSRGDQSDAPDGARLRHPGDPRELHLPRRHRHAALQRRAAAGDV